MPDSKRRAVKKTPSSARQWKRAKHHEIEVPSGNICLVKRPGPEAFLTEGLLPDSLTPLVQKAINHGKGLPPEKEEELMKSPEDLKKILDGLNRMLLRLVVEPKLFDHRVNEENKASLEEKAGRELVIGETIPDELRDDDELYPDEVDLNDKLFIFNFAVGGSADLARFRAELEARVGDLQPG